MGLQELLKALVMSDSQDERMELAEQITGITDTMGSGEGSITQEMYDGVIAERDGALTDLSTSKQKYIDRFFSGNADEEKKEEKETEESKMSDDEKRAVSVTPESLIEEEKKKEV